MDTKLTLKLNSRVIERAKLYAQREQTSLSKLIENYLGLLIDPIEQNEITPLVKRLSGVITLPKNTDEKKAYQRHLTKKYGHKK